ncbi:MAG: EamA family transporter [Bacteroidetes bacterium]|nr:EamA family transporter [Bacteroidota bacterium]
MSNGTPDQNPNEELRQHLLGMGCMALAAIVFPVKDSFIKAQDERVPALLAIAVYFLAQFVIGMAALFLTGNPARRNPFSAMTGLHLSRSLALACSLGLFFISLRYVPIAVAVTLFTMQSLFCLLFAKLLLNEAIRPIHIVFVAIATGGVLLIIRPSQLDANALTNLMPVISAALFGLYIILTRKLGGAQSHFQLLCQDGAIATILFGGLYLVVLGAGEGTIPAIVWDPVLFLLPPVLAAAIGTVSSTMMISAARLAPAVKIAPASYLEIASAALIGTFVFGEILDFITCVGIAVIVAVCLANALINDPHS